jgi:leucyl-tRNA synthetase
VVQVNGKLRDRITAPVSITEAEARQLALERERVKPYLEGKEVAKVIYVPGVSVRLINFVVK